MSCNHHCYDCHIPNCPQRVRQSIGPRVVPMFADPPEWSADKVYSPLTLVLYNGATYMSRCCVPAGSPLPSEDPFYNKYWVMVYDMSAQVAQYREEVAKLSEKVTAFEGQIVEWEDMVEKWTALIMDWQSQFPTLTEGLAKITERVAALEPVVAQHTTDIEALKQKDTDLENRVDSAESRLDNLEPRMTAAEGEISGLHTEQETQNNRLDALNQEQLQQNAQIKANHDLAVKNQQNINANLVQIQENAKNIKANAAKIADHAAQLENIHDTNAEQDAAIANNAAAIEQNKTDIDQAEALAQQVKDELTHTNARLDEVEQKNTDQDAAIAAETSRATEAEAALDAKITAETSRATEAEDALGQRIDSESEARADKDTELNAAIEEVKGQVADLTDGTTAMPYVKKAGDTMTGALNLPAPTENSNAANKKYVDDKDAALDAAIKKEIQDRETAIEGIQTEIDGVTGDLSGYLPLTGGTMTGALNVQTPTEDNNAATKAYVDQAVQNATDPELEGRVDALETSQATQDTEIANLKNGSTALPYIKDTGDTVTGTYDFTGADLTVKAPTADASPATKAYVDSKITDLENGSTTLPYVKKTGDSMTGVLNMSNNKVTNVADPTANGDAVNYKTMNAMKTALESQIENLSGLLDDANQKIQDLEQRVEELEQNPPQPVDPATKFNQIDLSNYVGSLSGSTVNTASDFKAALQYILDNNTGKHFYYGTDHAGTTWYFTSNVELSTLRLDFYICGNGVKNNGTAVQETFKMNKYVEPTPGYGGNTPPFGFEQRLANSITISDVSENFVPFGTAVNEYQDFANKWYIGTTNYAGSNWHCFMFTKTTLDKYTQTTANTYVLMINNSQLPINNTTEGKWAAQFNVVFSEPIEFPPPGYKSHNGAYVFMSSSTTTGTLDEAFKYVDAAPGPNKYFKYNMDIRATTVERVEPKCFAKLNTSNSGRIAYEHDGIWYYGQGVWYTD